MPPLILEVAVPVPLRRSFHYLAPPDADARALKPGIRLRVPFGRQKLVGVLLGTSDHSDLPLDKLKAAVAVLDREPVLEGPLLAMLRWAADYYQHPIGEVLHTALPALLRQGESAELTQLRLFASPSASIDDLSRAPAQRALLTALTTHPEGLSRLQIRQMDFSAQIIQQLVSRQFAEWREVAQHAANLTADGAVEGQALVLNDEQDAALAKVLEPGTHLLFGITGSGKTEVYLQAIDEVLKAGQQALVLVPEIGLTPQTIARFENRFRQRVHALHSGLTDRERLNTWQMAGEGRAQLIIGTRSAIFTPLKNPGLIVIDEEHDGSFKQNDGFRYSARDLAVVRGQREKIPVVLGSATPSSETLHNANSGKYSLSLLNKRANDARLADFRIIGIQHELLQDGFSAPLVKLIDDHLKQGNQVLVFLNRRGFAPVLLCRQCNWMAHCHRCDARMTYHLSLGVLVCHHCGHQETVQKTCPECHAANLAPLGIGTQRLQQRLEQLFPGQNIIRIDRDTTRRKDAMKNIMLEVNSGEPAILLGTQLLAKGHHFPDVTLVAIMDLDSGFYSADYRAIERMGQLLLQVSGRAGRAEKPGTVAVQTRFPEQPILHTLLYQGYDTFIRQILNERSEYQLPPFSYQALIRAEATGKDLAISFLDLLAGHTTHQKGVEVLGPVPASMERRAGKYRAQLLVTASRRKPLNECLRDCANFAESHPLARKVRWSIDVDPYDLY